MRARSFENHPKNNDNNSKQQQATTQKKQTHRTGTSRGRDQCDETQRCGLPRHVGGLQPGICEQGQRDGGAVGVHNNTLKRTGQVAAYEQERRLPQTKRNADTALVAQLVAQAGGNCSRLHVANHTQQRAVHKHDEVCGAKGVAAVTRAGGGRGGDVVRSTTGNTHTHTHTHSQTHPASLMYDGPRCSCTRCSHASLLGRAMDLAMDRRDSCDPTE